MKSTNTFLFTCFVLLHTLVSAAHQTSEMVIAYSSPQKVWELTPQARACTISTIHRGDFPAALGPQAQWLKIWDMGVQSTYESAFYSTCPDSIATVVINVDDAFTVYLNGEIIGQGADWMTIYSFKVHLRCGLNTLKIVAVSNQANGAFIFKVTQDQTNCFKCGETATYNYDTCVCQCRSNCPCRADQTFALYPTCGCKCNNAVFTRCNPSEFFDQNTCSCKCYKKFCRPGFEQDPQNCNCRCMAQACTQDQEWDYTTCSCIPSTHTCSKQNEVWSAAAKRCVCSGNISCPNGKQFNMNLCQCV